MYPNQYGNMGVQSAYLQNLQDVKNFFRRPAVLIAAILYSVQVVLNIFSMINGSELQQDIFSSFYFYYDMPTPNYGAGATQVITVVSAVIGSIIPILIAVSLWIIYLRSRSSNPQASPSAGFTILYVLSFIALIAISLLLLLIVAGFVMALSLSNLSYWESQVALFVVILVMIIVAPLFLLFVIAQFRFTAALRASAKGPVLKPNGSVMFAVLYIIMGTFLVLNVIQRLSIAFSLSGVYSSYYIYDKGEMTFALIVSIVSAAIAILMAVVALSYNSYVKKKRMEYAARQNAGYYTQNGQAYYRPDMGYSQQSPDVNTQALYQNQAYYVPSTAQPGQPPYPGYSVPTDQTPEQRQAPQPAMPQIPVQQAQEPPVFTSPFHGEEENGGEERPGSQISEENPRMVCPVCGCEVTEEAAFCPQCGTSLNR